MKDVVVENTNEHPVVIAVTGASGVVYAHRTLELLLKSGVSVHLVITKTATHIIEVELPNEKSDLLLNSQDVVRHDPSSYSETIASGSYMTSGMIVIPASMGTIGRIASGTSDNLIIRTADVHMKEKRKLIVVPRETPFNRIHLENLMKLHDAGALIMPATPSFYSKADSIDDLVDTVVARVLDHIGIKHNLDVRYHGKE